MGELSAASRMMAASRIYNAVQSSFAHGEVLPPGTIEESFEAFVKAIADNADRRHFDFEAMRFAAALKNGHSGFHDPWLSEEKGMPLPFFARRLGQDGWIVTYSRSPDVPIGAQILSIDDQPIEDFVSERLNFVAASNTRAAELVLWWRSFLFPVRFRLGLDDGREVVVDRFWPEKQEWVEELPALKEIGDRLFLLDIASFADPKYEAAALETVRALRPDDRLIVDVRKNDGGSTPVQLSCHLMDRPFQGWASKARQYNALHKAWGSPDSWYMEDPAWFQPESKGFCGRMAILIGGATGSAAEDFVMPFKESGRALIVGETTFGSSGQPLTVSLMDRMTFRVGTRRQFFPDGRLFEGVGIEPDNAVSLSRDDVLAGRDPVVDQAVALLD